MRIAENDYSSKLDGVIDIFTILHMIQHNQSNPREMADIYIMYIYIGSLLDATIID